MTSTSDIGSSVRGGLACAEVSDAGSGDDDGVGRVLLEASDIGVELTRLVRRLIAGTRLLCDDGTDDGTQGHVFLDLEVDGVRCLLTRCRSDEEPGRRRLTPREFEVAQLVATGLTNPAIAAKLGVSPWTISTHVRRIFAKLDVPTRAAMVAVIADARRDQPAVNYIVSPRSGGVDGAWESR